MHSTKMAYVENASCLVNVWTVSERAPFKHLPSPPTLTWVSLGALGHMFAFSNETRSLDDARAACEQQVRKPQLVGRLVVSLIICGTFSLSLFYLFIYF